MKDKLLNIIIIILLLFIVLGIIFKIFSKDKLDNPVEMPPVNENTNKYHINISNKELTNEDIVITITADISDFSYFIDNQGMRIDNKELVVTITDNGDYHFYLYDNRGVMEPIDINIKNIDKKEPTGTCIVEIKEDGNKCQIEAQDENGILKYVYDGNEYTTSEFPVTEDKSEYQVTIYDKANNSQTINCEIKRNYDKPIGPTSETIYAQYDSDTLKYWIEKKSTYSIIHLWVEDAYNQMKTAVPNPYRTLATVEKLMNKEINAKGYQNKGMIVTNGSGFVSKQFDSHFITWTF